MLYEFECPWCQKIFKRDTKFVNKAISRGQESFCCSLSCSRAFLNIGQDTSKVKMIRSKKFLKELYQDYNSGRYSIRSLERHHGIGKKLIRQLLDNFDFSQEEIMSIGYGSKRLNNGRTR